MMKAKTPLRLVRAALYFLLLTTSGHLTGQTVIFEYDDCGNRNLQKVLYPQADPLTHHGEAENPGNQTWMINDTKITVAPNPCEGELSISAINLRPGSGAWFILHDLQGRPVAGMQPLETENRLDIRQHKRGLYILTISIGDESNRWKVIKQ